MREADKMRRTVIKALRETGMPWRIENGAKHKKIWLDGQMIAVMHNGSHNAGKDARNLVWAIRRRAS